MNRLNEGLDTVAQLHALYSQNTTMLRGWQAVR